ncbi:hypothetical protein B7P43_G12399 [Cryptotermes secundus]|nr:uncharacterized protein LOC111872240 isoform X3 [Cryptotermes secundus]PNF19015.1 hypothetical protein B7P43_G12399 [Cryptotermes secundus]
MDSMETDINFLKDVIKPQYGRALYSGRRRGRPRGRGSRGRGRSSSAQHVLNKDRDLEQSSEDSSTVQIGANAVSFRVPDGDAKPSASSDCMDSMETDINFLKDVIKPQYGRALYSGRRRGRRPRGHGSRGCGRSSSAQHVLNKDRDLEQSSEDSSTVQTALDTMEEEDSLMDEESQQYGRGVHSGRRRGRSRGRGRGRVSRGYGRVNFGYRILRREKVLEQSSDVNDLVKVNCYKCSEEMQKRYFERHNRIKHCGLAWIEGGDPIDFNDEKLLIRILTRIRHTKKFLICEDCGTSKRSVVGFISHLQCCRKSDAERVRLKMPCEICGRVMLPASLKVHMYTVHKNPPNVEEPITQDEMKVDSKMKRAAATKAVSLMQEFIKDEDMAEGNEKPTKHSDGLYVKVELRDINGLRCGAWKRSIKQFGKISCRHIGCSFESKTIEESLEHYFSCPMAPKKGYSCRVCSFHCEDEPDMLTHITSEHGDSPECSGNSGSDSSGESELNIENEKEPLVKKMKTVSSSVLRYKPYGKMKTANKMMFLSREPSCPVSGDKPYVPAVKWTLTFHLENYMQSLYPNIHSTPDDWIPLTAAAAAPYLPRTKESVQVSHLSMKHRVLAWPQKAVKQWHRLKLFEAQVIEGTPVFFAGGPVWATAWCPVPLQKAIHHTAHLNQYLAVSCHSHMDDTYISGRSYSHSGLLQIWDFGHLDHQQPCTVPKLALGIAHDYGAVWCMEWCPSGCYEPPDVGVPECRLRRLGLLGAACSDGTIRIFSICFPSEVQDKICDSTPIFKVDAMLTLVLDDRQTCLLGDSTWQCTRLSWYKGKGHRIIAGSFTNGMVAVWDISTESPLLSKRTGKSYIIYPYHCFQAHIGVVSAIALSPHGGGRYMMTGSFDRTTKHWDLENTSAPITVNKRGSVTDGVWLTHWVSAVNSLDDSYSLGHANGTLNPVRRFGFSSYPLLPQNSVAWGLSTCDWVNAVAQGTLAGELTVIFSHQLLNGIDTEKARKDNRMVIGYIEVTNLEDQEGDVFVNGSIAEKTDSLKNSAGVQLLDKTLHKHGVMDVDDTMLANIVHVKPLTTDINSFSGVRSQFSSEHQFSELKSTESTPFVRKGSNVDELDISTIGNCDLSVSCHESERTDGEDQNYEVTNGCIQDGAERDFKAPSRSSNISLESDVESRNSTITRNLPYSVVTEGTTLSDVSHADISVPHSTDMGRCFNREFSEVPEDVCKAAASMKEDVDRREKTDGMGHNDDNDKDIVVETKNRKKTLTRVKFKSYDEARKKCGLILCNFPTNNLKHMPEEARLWMRQSEKMRTVDVDTYPISSINRVSWNPNCRSFLWLAAGYHCGLVRVPCMKAMHCKPIEDILRHGERKVAELLNEDSKNLI